MALLTDPEIYQLQSIYPQLDIKPLTSQEERYLVLRVRGATMASAARAAGLAPRHATEFEATSEYLALRAYLAEIKFGMKQIEVAIDRNMLNVMLLDAHSKAANSMEEIAAIRELGKMNDLYLDARHRSGVEVNISNGAVVNGSVSVRQLEKMTDAELIQLSEEDYSLEPADSAT